MKTLRHEAVHLAQDCAAGHNNVELNLLSEPTAIVAHTDEYVEHMLSHYQTNDLHVLLSEAEAFILEQRSSAFIAEVVKHNCG